MQDRRTQDSRGHPEARRRASPRGRSAGLRLVGSSSKGQTAADSILRRALSLCGRFVQISFAAESNAGLPRFGLAVAPEPRRRDVKRSRGIGNARVQATKETLGVGMRAGVGVGVTGEAPAPRCPLPSPAAGGPGQKTNGFAGTGGEGEPGPNAADSGWWAGGLGHPSFELWGPSSLRRGRLALRAGRGGTGHGWPCYPSRRRKGLRGKRLGRGSHPPPVNIRPPLCAERHSRGSARVVHPETNSYRHPPSPVGHVTPGPRHAVVLRRPKAKPSTRYLQPGPPKPGREGGPDPELFWVPE
jgi:hypothetical protein